MKNLALNAIKRQLDCSLQMVYETINGCKVYSKKVIG